MKTAVLGATGLVGRIMLDYLARRPWVDEEPLLLCSARSAGRVMPFRDRELVCQDAAGSDFEGVRLALFSAGAGASHRFAPLLNEAGAWVVDNSSAFRMEPEVPLVVPEINPALVPTLPAEATGRGGIIANPNCSTIQIALALAPLAQSFGLAEAHVTTLQSVSGAGQRALVQLDRELAREAGAAAPPNAPDAPAFPQQIALNVIPEIGEALPDGSFTEETKVVQELRKILDLPELAVTCTATRVGVRQAHCAAVRAILSREVSASEAFEVLDGWPGLSVEPSPHGYRTPLQLAGQTTVHVGRLRQDPNRRDTLLFWVVADNLHKGAACNAAQIADLLVGDREP